MGQNRLLTAVVAALLAWPASAHAQDSVELWGGWGTWSGEDADTFNDGYTVGMSYVADIGWPIDLGVDVGFPRFGFESPGDIIPSAVEFQASVILRRWLLDGERGLQPFLGTRFGYTRLGAELDTEERDFLFEQDGYLIGPQIGFVVPTGRTLAPIVVFEALYQHYGPSTLLLDDIESPGDAGSAWRIFVKVGVTFGSGWERRGS